MPALGDKRKKLAESGARLYKGALRNAFDPARVGRILSLTEG